MTGEFSGLLTLLSPSIDLRTHQFHIDHVFPKSRFTKARLRRAGVSDAKHEAYADCANRIANLQLLEGISNVEKRAKMPREWLVEHLQDKGARQHYRELYFLGEVPEHMADFPEFYEARTRKTAKENWADCGIPSDSGAGSRRRPVPNVCQVSRLWA